MCVRVDLWCIYQHVNNEWCNAAHVSFRIGVRCTSFQMFNGVKSGSVIENRMWCECILRFYHCTFRGVCLKRMRLEAENTVHIRDDIWFIFSYAFLFSSFACSNKSNVWVNNACAECNTCAVYFSFALALDFDGAGKVRKVFKHITYVNFRWMSNFSNRNYLITWNVLWTFAIAHVSIFSYRAIRRITKHTQLYVISFVTVLGLMGIYVVFSRHIEWFLTAQLSHSLVVDRFGTQSHWQIISILYNRNLGTGQTNNSCKVWIVLCRRFFAHIIRFITKVVDQTKSVESDVIRFWRWWGICIRPWTHLSGVFLLLFLLQNTIINIFV